MTRLIIEFACRTWHSVGGTTKKVHIARAIYFETDEDTGAEEVKDILEADLFINDQSQAAFITLHMLDWAADFDVIEFYDATSYTEAVPVPFATVSRMDPSEECTAMRFTSYMLHMMVAHVRGYTDDDGELVKGRGTNLFEAYRNKPQGDHWAYLAKGR